MSSLPHQAVAEVPRGVFCLLPAGSGAGKHLTVYSDPSVDGISVRQKWYELESREGVFDFSFLDAVTSMARASGKKVLLRISTSGGSASRGGNTPDWVFDAIKAEPLPASQKFFTFDDNGTPCTIPVFWDPVYLAKKKAMIRALGAHFANDPAVKIVSASFANAKSEDWGVPHTPTDVSNWLAAGYTSYKVLEAGRQIIDETMTAFPYQYVTLSVGGSGSNLDPDVNYVARNAVLAARASWPGRLIVQKNTLSTKVSPAPGTDTLYQIVSDSTPDVGAQMLWFCYGDSTYRMNGGVPIDPSKALTASVDLGLGYGLKYIEIYRTDVLNLPKPTKYAHDALTAPTPTPTPSPSATPTATPAPTATPSPTSTPSPTPNPTATPTPTPSPSPTPTPSATPTATPTPSPTATPTPTPTPSPTPSPTFALPRGVFSLLTDRARAASGVLANSNVDGISIRFHWNVIAPTATNGVPDYDWSNLDAAIANARSAGKQVTLTIGTGGGGPQTSGAPDGALPAWLVAKIKNAGGQFFSFIDKGYVRTIPVFWDATFMAEKHRMLTDVGTRYGNNPNISAVRVSFGNARTMDWNMPDGSDTDSLGGSEVSRWLNLGYKSEKMIAAGDDCIDAAAASFPRACIVFNSGNISHQLDSLYPSYETGGKSDYVSQTVFDHAATKYGKDRIAMQHDSLSAKVYQNAPFSAQPTSLKSPNQWTIMYYNRPHLTAQMLWFCYGDKTYRMNGGIAADPSTVLVEAVQAGADYGTQYQEFYECDVVNLPTAIARAHAILTAN